MVHDRLDFGTDPNDWWTGSDGLDLWIVEIRELTGVRTKCHAHVDTAEGGQFSVSVRPGVTAQSPQPTFADVKD